ncbi:MAG TPA: FtsX-like permease family protein [Actinophytocola sp.]|uniref:FtsX-like permease family protein n=1 Tax=Actinophytocola sp. TaxID=1872138 RepID=UPI002E03906E|nr:FtsX-like permease family protein [Actinophytocola sp.]
MLRIGLRMLRFRKGGFAATFIALFFGAALVMACGGLLETGVRTEVAPQRLAEAQLIVTGDQTYQLPKRDPNDEEEDTESATLAERVRLDRSLIDTVRAVPGVARAIGDASFPIALLHDGKPVGAQPVGHPWASAELAPYRIVAGTPPARPGEVVLEAPAQVGDRVDVLVRGAPEHLTVTGIAAPAHPIGQPAAFFSDADVQRLAARVDAIGVLAAPGTDLGALRDRLGEALRGTPATILTGTDRGLAEFPEALRSSEGLIALAAVIGGFSIMVAMFVVASTLGLSIQHRYRELALLRAIGTTPRQLRRMVLGEALAVSIVATGLACVPGVLLGGWLFDRLAGLGVVPGVVEFHQGFVPIIVGIGSGLLTALVAGYVAARKAGAARPTEALADAEIQRRWVSPVRIVGAALCFGGGIALAIVTMTVFEGPIAASTAGPSVMLWAVGLAMIAPGLTRLMIAVLRWPVRAVTGLAGHLAVLNARARTARLAAAVTPIMLATGIATANLYLQTTQSHAAEAAFTQSLRADAVLSSTTGGGLAPGLADRVRALPGVAGASEFVTSTGFVARPHDDTVGEDGWPLQGISADGVTASSAVEVTAGRLTDLRGDTVALPAGALGRGVGDTITLKLGDGAVLDVRVVALFTGTPGFEKMLLPVELLAAHTTLGLPTQILVAAAPGAQLAEALAGLVAGVPGVAVADRATLTAAYAEQQDIQASVNYLMVGMIMAYTAISVVNTLVMATARRRREFGLQRLTGSTRGQVLRMMSVEAVLVAAIGIVLGTLVSTTTLVPFSLVVSGTPVPHGPLWIYLAVVGTAGLLTMVATVLPTWFTTRTRPAEAAVSA